MATGYVWRPVGGVLWYEVTLQVGLGQGPWDELEAPDVLVGVWWGQRSW